MKKYLESSYYIDWKQVEVLRLAQVLAEGANNDILLIAQRCFEFVRDEIKHSWDYGLNPVTCKASDVLKHETGFCYAKSHLLAALLRANGIPAGLCYQRLLIESGRPAFCLHGLNALFLPNHGWYRVDARGNKSGITAAFCPPVERLAFSIEAQGESDLPEIWFEPLPIVIDALTQHQDFQQVADNLPDIVLIS